MDETVARTAKATKLFLTLEEAGADATYVKNMGDREWALATGAAQVNYPSDVTRSMVVRMFETKERFKPPEDPFQGFPRY